MTQIGAPRPSFDRIVRRCSVKAACSTGLAVVLVATAGACQASGASGHTLFVRAAASRGGDGSAAAPFRSPGVALEHAVPGDTVRVLAGRYAPFAIDVADVTVAGKHGATVVGTPGAAAVVAVAASKVTVTGLTITGCVPQSAPPGGLETHAPAGIRIDARTAHVTIRGNTVANGRGVNSEGQRFGCYGIFSYRSTAATIFGNRVYHNGYGIALSGGGHGTVIANNIVHDNDVLIRNTVSTADDDFGAIGIGFGQADGAVARHNTVYNNSGPSHDWGSDGGAFEIFSSSHIAMVANRMYNNDDVLETGGDPQECKDNSFDGNTASGRTPASALAVSSGLILRCAQHMHIRANTISNVDWWTFWIYNSAPAAAPSSTDRLSITRNTITQTSAQVYAIGQLGRRPQMNIDSNTYDYAVNFASTPTGKLHSFADWKHRTGWDARGRSHA